MKGFIIIILFSFSTLLGVAQTSWVGEDLPWMIERRSNGVRRISQFIPSDSMMGARKLVKTTCYDQHGYETGPLIELQYDTLGRLTRRLEKQHREIAELLEGNDCNGRGTSCADQMVKALRAAQEARK